MFPLYIIISGIDTIFCNVNFVLAKDSRPVRIRFIVRAVVALQKLTWQTGGMKFSFPKLKFNYLILKNH